MRFVVLEFVFEGRYLSLSPLLGLGTSGGVGGGGGLPAAAAAVAAAGAPLGPVALLLSRRRRAAARFREDERGGARRAAVGVLLRGGRTLRERIGSTRETEMSIVGDCGE